MTDRDFRMPDTLLPQPVDLARVETAVDALGYQFLAADDRLIMPWPNHRISVYFGQESGLHLTMLARMRMTLDLSMINEVAPVLNTWNTERIAPAALLHIADMGEVEIHFRSSLSVDEGVSTDQLMQFIQLTINTVEMAVDTVLEMFSELDIDGAGSDELRTEQDESDLTEEIHGLFIPPTVPYSNFEYGQERRRMDSPHHPSASDPEDDGDIFRNSEDTGEYDDIWDASADTGANLDGDHTEENSEGDPATLPEEADAENPPVRETRDEPFLPIFSDFSDDDLREAPDSDDSDDDQLNLLDLLGGDSSIDIPAIASGSVTNPAPGSLPEPFDSDDDRNDTPEYPREVTLERVRDHLADIGVVKTSGEDDFLVAWINEVFLGFFIDNGPTFLVKGHWDPDMDPDRDFIKLFMMCNQWNERSLTTKAFCHRDPQGLQVRVEFAVPTAEGLTSSQLRHNIALSIHHILQAVDSLSMEATGTSIVDWPEKN